MMGTYKQQRHAASQQHRTRKNTGTAYRPSNKTLSTLQARAIASVPVQRLQTLQRQAAPTLQREVDTSHNPSVGRGDPDYKYPLPESDGIPTWADKSYGKPAYDENGVLKNDPADGVRTWAHEEYRNKVGKTGVVDRSSGPLVPTYGPDETPGWEKNDPTGVPEWAKKEYRKEAPRVLIASVADGKIGSIYFPGGRIRTTHGSGPKKSTHGETLQYNIDRNAAEAEFAKKNPNLLKKLRKQGRKLAKKDPKMTHEMIERLAYKGYFHEEAKYIARKLNVPKPSSMPAFVRLVTGGRKLPSWAGDAINSPDEAPDMDTETTGKLFEVFRGINGRVESWHPSRGAAKKWQTNKQVMSVLHAAIKHLKVKKIKEANARNIAFYNFVEHRVPDFAKLIRKPDEIRTR